MNNLRRVMMALSASAILAVSSGCSTYGKIFTGSEAPQLLKSTETHRDLMSLPEPRGKVVAAVYRFRDQTGQRKITQSFSNAVTQGATSILVKALNDSGWFTVVEREGLSNLATERSVHIKKFKGGKGGIPLLIGADILLEGSIIAYDSNVKTGGFGARYLGIGTRTEYRVDQVTLNLRAVHVSTGKVLNSVTTTKTIYSNQVSGDVFKFVKFKRLLEVETGYTSNEPAQLAVVETIESALMHLLVEGIKDNHWALLNQEDINTPVVQAYLDRLDSTFAGAL